MKRIAMLLLIGLLTACVTPPGGSGVGPSNRLIAGADPQIAAAVRARPGDPQAWHQLGNYYAENNQPIEAAQAYREALRRGPFPRSQFNLGLMLVWQGVNEMTAASQELPADSGGRELTERMLRLLGDAGL
jgi:predicted Zn-dependent protease